MCIRTKEVLTKFRLTVDTLIYWENIKVIPKIYKDSSEYTNYQEDALHFIYLPICMRNAEVQLTI